MARLKTLAEIDERIKSLQEKKKEMQKKADKKRTRRLIAVGGLVEKYCCEIENLEAFEKDLKSSTNSFCQFVRQHQPERVVEEWREKAKKEAEKKQKAEAEKAGVFVM